MIKYFSEAPCRPKHPHKQARIKIKIYVRLLVLESKNVNTLHGGESLLVFVLNPDDFFNK